MKKSHIASYENSDRDALAESDDPHALIEVLLNELVRHMQSFLHHFEGDQEAQVKRNTHFSKSLSIIYALQKSLDFDNGGEVAESMFRIYEFAKQTLLKTYRTSEKAGTEQAIQSLKEILEAWKQIKPGAAAE